MRCSDCNERIMWVDTLGGARLALDVRATDQPVRSGFVLVSKEGRVRHPFNGGVYRLHDESCAPRVAEREAELLRQQAEQKQRKEALATRRGNIRGAVQAAMKALGTAK